jgi:Methyltransferase domain
MNVLLKCAIQWGLSLVPGGDRINDRLQRIRKMLPDWHFEKKIDDAQVILDLVKRHSLTGAGASPLVGLEIGAGWDMQLPLAMRASGLSKIHCIDIRRHLDGARIGEAVKRVRSRSDAGRPGLPEWSCPSDSEIEKHLESGYGIHYQAPCDARRTAFPTGFLDLYLSYNVFEHVPKEELSAILAESFRLLKPGAISVHCIDLQDHWAYADLRYPVHGFLRYGKLAWKLMNPPIHYQNRLRSKQFKAMACDAGFELVEALEVGADPQQLTTLRSRGFVHEDLRSLGTAEELGITSLRLVLRKPA